MVVWIKAHQVELLAAWGGLATLLLALSELLGLSKKYESNAIAQLILKVLRKGAKQEEPKSDQAA